MRYIAIALLLLVPAAADAQQPNRARKYVQEVRERSTANPAPPRDDRGRQPRNVRQRDHRDQDRWPQTHRPFFNQRFRHQQSFGFGSYYAVPSYGYGFGYFGPAGETYEPSRRGERDTPGKVIVTGVLRLEVTPASGLEYYVDGLYFGSSSNLGTLLEMNPGPRRIEVRAAGYKPLVFDTRIFAGSETTFRASMEPLAQQPPAQATGNRTMFIIPGCYMGNARPSASELRPGCDINRLVTR
jgi:hypothetical protein